MDTTPTQRDHWTAAARDGHLRPRTGEPDRYDVTRTGLADAGLGCVNDDMCVLQTGHPGDCDHVLAVRAATVSSGYPTAGDMAALAFLPQDPPAGPVGGHTYL